MESSNSGGGEKPKRILKNEEVRQYEPMVESFIRDSCVKNWSEAKKGGPDAFLGSSGYSLQDLRQQLRTEVCVALQNYNPNFRTKEGKTVKESTFVYQHLTFRVGQLMKRLTKRRMGYGVRHNPVHLLVKDGAQEQSILDLDLINSIDTKSELKAANKSQVEQWLERKRKW